ncbi:MAG: hypothetical protein PHD21_06555 [Flavobacteriales bacterium]|nr:hypothetical protein [Flavobacteriales bacterium]
MNLPKFLLGDNTDCDDAIFVIHTQYPRFIINLVDDDVEWMDDVSEEDERELAEESEKLFVQAGEFYEREIERIEKDL